MNFTNELSFGYGSNLDLQDWERWCHENYGDSNSIEMMPGIFILPDYELAFHYYSRRRGGGALDVVPLRGHAVVGKLFKTNDEWNTLDQKEGVPNHYKKIPVTVLDENGNSLNVFTYVVTSEKRKQKHVPPSDEYFQAVMRGYKTHGILEKYPWAKIQLTKASQHLTVSSGINHVYTYGTLRKGEERVDTMNVYSEKVYDDCKLEGILLNLGSYPGLVAGDGSVIGEIHYTPKIQNTLNKLDYIENFQGSDIENSLFRRVIVKSEGKFCWTYVWNGSPDDGQIIQSGDWCKR